MNILVIIALAVIGIAIVFLGIILIKMNTALTANTRVLTNITEDITAHVEREVIKAMVTSHTNGSNADYK